MLANITLMVKNTDNLEENKQIRQKHIVEFYDKNKCKINY